MIATGLDRLLSDTSPLDGRRYALLSHQAAVTPTLRPAHLALADAGAPPTVLLGPEHGYYGVEQDMIAAVERVDAGMSGCSAASRAATRARSRSNLGAVSSRTITGEPASTTRPSAFGRAAMRPATSALRTTSLADATLPVRWTVTR